MRLPLAALVASACACTAPASAAVVVLAQNISFATTAYTFGVSPGDTFTFQYAPREQFDPAPSLISTAGTAQVITVFGNPSVAFTDPPTTFGPNSFPGFGSVTTPSRATGSLTDSDLGLRYTVGGNTYYGYARFFNSTITRIAFETTPNTAILAGSVPEPGTWAMMILGFGAVGGVMRRRATVVVMA